MVADVDTWAEAVVDIITAGHAVAIAVGVNKQLGWKAASIGGLFQFRAVGHRL
ncbi:hypothetical protein HMPREF9695_04240 [Afipia broomeae ATCC 49717]|uniref:Uncharacterized protein n=1 Tax=Afipia broomeae ATCC 49717 TaxID=883078 RepID=K8P3U0_9BRAD|nr:hypothetical protein HMPREF9695_04240 [Afipia broomeae ATCC 49717]